jgi:hypothetical protein
VLQALAATQRKLTHAGGRALTAYEYRGELFDDMEYFDAVNDLFECGYHVFTCSYYCDGYFV